jgi:hypothetical protein
VLLRVLICIIHPLIFAQPSKIRPPTALLSYYVSKSNNTREQGMASLILVAIYHLLIFLSHFENLTHDDLLYIDLRLVVKHDSSACRARGALVTSWH